MKALVIGGAGFIGSHTVDALIEKGFEVRILDKLQKPVHTKGVPKYIHEEVQNKLKIPISSNVRSLNVAVTASISAAEALRQIKKI